MVSIMHTQLDTFTLANSEHFKRFKHTLSVQGVIRMAAGAQMVKKGSGETGGASILPLSWPGRKAGQAVAGGEPGARVTVAAEERSSAGKASQRDQGARR